MNSTEVSPAVSEEDVASVTAKSVDINSTTELPVFRDHSNFGMRCLIDSGAATSVVSKDFVDAHGLPRKKLKSPINIVSIVGGRERIKEEARFQPFGTQEVLAKVGTLRPDVDAILGYPWMKKAKVKFDYSGNLSFTLPDGSAGHVSRNKRMKEGEDIIMTKRQLRKSVRREEVDCVWQIGQDEVLVNALSDSKEGLVPQDLRALIKMYPKVFPKEPKLTELPKPRTTLSQPAMAIDTGDHAPIKSRYYRMGPEDLKELKRQLKVLLDAKMIRPSISPWSSPVLFVKKKNGDRRMVIDYRKLNQITKSDAYPMPRIQDNLDRLGQAKVFTIMDATSGFHQNILDEKDCEKTAFTTRYGSFEFLVTPFGLKNSPSAFQRMMDEVLGPLKDECVICYMDDLLVYSLDKKQHRTDLARVASRLNQYGIQINMKKSIFGTDQITYCGYRVQGGRTTVDPDKLLVLEKWPVPANVSAVRSFLGFVGYYRRYIKNFAGIAAPLTDLLKKSNSWQWTVKEQDAFDELRKAMMTRPVLRTPDDTKPFHITPDAGPLAIGGILQQEFSDGFHPIAYEYHRLSEAEERYTQYEKEFFALLHCLRKWRHYFEGQTVFVHSDNSALVQFGKTKRDPHHRIARWLEEYNMWSPDVVHIQGKLNPADAPSRVLIDTTPISDIDWERGLQVNAMVSSEEMETTFDDELDWPLHIAHFLETDSWLLDKEDTRYSKLLKESAHFRFTDEGLFMRILKDGKSLRPYLPFSDRPATLKRFHDGIGHLKFESVVELLERRFWWPTLRSDLKEFISTCAQCQLDATGQPKHPPPSRPLPSVAIPFERWGIDWVGPLPITKNGNSYVITAIDYATRWVVALAVPEVNQNVLAKFLYAKILLQFGTPFELISDRGSAFLAGALQDYLKAQKIKHFATTPYHPQTNGMVERMHAMLGHALTTLTNGRKETWDEYIEETLWAIRIRKHAVTKYSPFYLVYGLDPRIPGDTQPVRTKGTLTPEEIKEARETHLQYRLEELGFGRAAAYRRSIQQAANMRKRLNLDQDAKDHYFSIGDMVKMKHHDKKKLEFDWKGPYHIVDLGYPGTYWIMKPNGERLKSTVNQRDLAPWLSRLNSNEDFFYDGTLNSNLNTTDTQVDEQHTIEEPQLNDQYEEETIEETQLIGSSSNTGAHSRGIPINVPNNLAFDKARAKRLGKQVNCFRSELCNQLQDVSDSRPTSKVNH